MKQKWVKHNEVRAKQGGAGHLYITASGYNISSGNSVMTITLIT